MMKALLNAILNDDRSAARELIRKDPSLPAARVSEAKLYESGILHWLYANDSALHLAAAGHRVQMVEILLRAVPHLLHAGAKPTARNHSGATPFHLAVQNTGRGGSGDETAKTAQHQIIEAMLAHGASPLMRDDRGLSVLDWVKSGWIRELIVDG